MVDFVGAGCGAVDLITVRGMRLIEKADVIIYAGSLVNPKLLDYAKEGCEIHNSAYMTLEDIIDVIKKAESENKSIVRLQTGDTSLYSALKEQTKRLDELGIAYNVCPGVSAFCGVGAALKTEYTPAEISQSVIITRCEGRTPVPQKEQLESLAVHGATMVIFLSAGMIDKVVEKLVLGGYSPSTPSAIVYKASWDDEKIVRCSLDTLSESAKKNNIDKIALIVVGNALGDDYYLSRLYAAEFETGWRKTKT